ncbi:MAG: hypothetical protein HOP19_22445, partial [Acidobacteria bacterium]|nr:hypothetical protein [Acidobacteriota bacterium]
LRQWGGFEPGTEATRWTGGLLEKLLETHRIARFRRRISQEPKGSGYAEIDKTIKLTEKLQRTRQIDALILFKDLDDDVSRRTALLQARDENNGLFVVVIATPKWKREAWILHGFECQTENEKQQLMAFQQTLGFDPRTRAENLRHNTANDPKMILQALLNEYASGEVRYQRQALCWQTTPLSLLRQRGRATYLNDFLDEIQQYLLPLIDPGSPHQKT